MRPFADDVIAEILATPTSCNKNVWSVRYHCGSILGQALCAPHFSSESELSASRGKVC